MFLFGLLLCLTLAPEKTERGAVNRIIPPSFVALRRLKYTTGFL